MVNLLFSLQPGGYGSYGGHGSSYSLGHGGYSMPMQSSHGSYSFPSKGGYSGLNLNNSNNFVNFN